MRLQAVVFRRMPAASTATVVPVTHSGGCGVQRRGAGDAWEEGTCCVEAYTHSVDHW